MPLPLIPATLQPGETNYPSDLQVLVNRLAANLFTPDTPKEFFRHNSPDQVPSDALWSDVRNGTLKFQDNQSQWRTALSANSSYGVEVDNATVQAGTAIFNSMQTPTVSMGVEISSFKVKPYTSNNRYVVLAHVPGISANGENINAYGTLVCGSVVFSLSCVNTGINRLQNMFLLGAYSPAPSDLNAAGEVTFKLRLGTDNAAVQLYYNRKSPTDTFNNFMRITMVGIEIPV
jgi:hypothetical protein